MFLWLMEITKETLPHSLLLQSAEVLMITLLKLKLTLRNEDLAYRQGAEFINL